MLAVNPPQLAELAPPQRLLLGPGPANVAPRVQAAAMAPLLGHLDPAYLQMMDEVQAGLRYAFQTTNRTTLAVPGTGSAGMEAALCSLLEAGDTAVIGVCGYFGNRLVEVAERCGATVVRVEGDWGQPLDAEALARACAQHRPKLLAAVHAETSTGVLQPVPALVAAAHEHGALLLLDTVTSLGGCPVCLDEWGVDAAYSGSQKCLGALPGLSPVSFSARAIAAVQARKRPVQSFYLDIPLLERYWSPERVYHHTAPATLTYALREALRVVVEEGLEARWARHRQVSDAFRAGIRAMGLQLLVDEENHLPQLTTVLIPAGIDDAAVRKALLAGWNIEVGGGLGPYRGNLWRVGLMGASCTPANALTLLDALGQILRG
ncbi:MAG TPA: alanine--glyoxylate aminotransferase family protein, partial [Chloroflexota bacterium]|nr:alanine--glyoxylate aminotransferase family protein [Chloroflexota bacterium]